MNEHRGLTKWEIIIIVVCFIIVVCIFAFTAWQASPASATEYVYVTPEPEPFNYFESEEQCQAWLDENTPRIPQVVMGGINFNGSNAPHPDYQCGYYAYQLMTLALKDGWLITECPLSGGRVQGRWVTPQGGYHTGCITRINGYYYYIEASPCKTQYTLKKINIPIEGKYK